jgi:tRNA threonylcarbamoyladenosine biosynthesis protein TsaE
LTAPERDGSRPGRPAPVAVETPESMRALGARLAAALRPGDLVVLAGPLGAGKTVFAQGVGRGLGVPGPITSPTFVLARVHEGGRLPLAHVDAYRLGSPEEIDAMDLDADVERAVTLVEWGTGLVEDLARSSLRVEIARPSGAEAGETRLVTLVPDGPDWAGRLAALGLGDRPGPGGSGPGGSGPGGSGPGGSGPDGAGQDAGQDSRAGRSDRGPAPAAP